MNDDSISENDLEKMIQELSNRTYGSIVEDYADDNQIKGGLRKSQRASNRLL